MKLYKIESKGRCEKHFGCILYNLHTEYQFGKYRKEFHDIVDMREMYKEQSCYYEYENDTFHKRQAHRIEYMLFMTEVCIPIDVRNIMLDLISLLCFMDEMYYYEDYDLDYNEFIEVHNITKDYIRGLYRNDKYYKGTYGTCQIDAIILETGPIVAGDIYTEDEFVYGLKVLYGDLGFTKEEYENNRDLVKFIYNKLYPDILLYKSNISINDIEHDKIFNIIERCV